jgi:hypothetical protein
VKFYLPCPEYVLGRLTTIKDSFNETTTEALGMLSPLRLRHLLGAVHILHAHFSAGDLKSREFDNAHWLIAGRLEGSDPQETLAARMLPLLLVFREEIGRTTTVRTIETASREEEHSRACIDARRAFLARSTESTAATFT